MKILIVSATEKEIEPLLKKLSAKKKYNEKVRSPLLWRGFRRDRIDIDILISGIGMVSTTYSCAKTINNSYDFAMNLGIAGSFKKNIKIADVVNVVWEKISELGAEDGKNFLSFKEINLKAENEFDNISPGKNSIINNLKKVSGITVNTVHGNKLSIKKIIKKFKPDVETMEGAAFIFVCKKEGIPCAQIRAVSNYVERRNKKSWNIPLAIKNLNETALQILDAF